MTDYQVKIITFIIACYGALVATIGLVISSVLGIIEVNRQKYLVSVTAEYSVLINLLNERSEPLVSITAINIGKGSAKITSVGFLNYDGSKIQLLRPYKLELPFELQEKRRCTTFWPCRDFVREDKVKQITHAYFQDETGVMWKGKISSKTRKVWYLANEEGWKIT